MASLDDKTIAVSRVYSRSMLQLAESAGQAEALGEELDQLADLAARDELFGDFLARPMIDPKARRESLEKLFRGRASDLLVDSLQVLNRKGRMGLLPAVAQTYREGLHALRHQVPVTVRTAVPLSPALRERLVQGLCKRLNGECLLTEVVDESLIGGLVVQAGDNKFDASVATGIKKLGDALLERGSREIESGAYLQGNADEADEER
jgi:F-type H+-transporting ATPase subunit delta